MNEKDIDILMSSNDVEKSVLVASEELTAIWISNYLDEINRVEKFFLFKSNICLYGNSRCRCSVEYNY